MNKTMGLSIDAMLRINAHDRVTNLSLEAPFGCYLTMLFLFFIVKEISETRNGRRYDSYA